MSGPNATPSIDDVPMNQRDDVLREYGVWNQDAPVRVARGTEAMAVALVRLRELNELRRVTLKEQTAALALLRREVETAHRRVDAQDDEIARLRTELARLQHFVQRIKAEAPTRLTMDEWTPIQLSQMADAVLRGDPCASA